MAAAFTVAERIMIHFKQKKCLENEVTCVVGVFTDTDGGSWEGC